MREDPNYSEERYLDEIKRESFRREVEADDEGVLKRAMADSLAAHRDSGGWVDEDEQLRST